MDGVNEPTLATGRLEAFSDGVFAIAVTLLILEIKVPTLHDTGQGALLGSALRDQWPAYLAYLTSFATILIMWVNHHSILARLRRADHTFFLLNGLLLLCITFVPFPTALLAEYLGHTGERLAAVVYTGTFVALAVVFNLLWRYAAHRQRLLKPEISDASVRRFSTTYLLGPPLYLVALLFAFVHVGASFALCMILAGLFAWPIPMPTD